MIVIPVYNMIIAPDATLYLQTEQVRRRSGGEDLEAGENVVLIVAKENTGSQDLSEDSFFPTGVSGSISELDEMHPENVTDAQRFAKMIAESGMNETARKEAEKVLNRFRQEGLDVLDPEQNNTFTDHYMNVPYDLSDVLFVCTANTTDNIPEPLLNRMEVISFNGDSPIEKLEIAKEHLVPKSMAQTGVSKEQMTIEDRAKESAKIAVSLVKSLLPEEAKKLKEHDLHIHVPAGAVPKDGPSTGVTLVTALASLLTGRIVDPHIAMTGEVALRGAVTPIGGLPEKLMAAERAGITTIFIPKGNMLDLKDVAPEVKDKLEIVLVSGIIEILVKTGVIAHQ